MEVQLWKKIDEIRSLLLINKSIHNTNNKNKLSNPKDYCKIQKSIWTQILIQTPQAAIWLWWAALK